MWAAATPTWAEAVRAACKWRFTSPSRFKWGFQDGPRVHPYSIFELSVNTTSGAPSFVRSLRKGWETTDIHRNCQHPGRKRSRSLTNAPCPIPSPFSLARGGGLRPSNARLPFPGEESGKGATTRKAALLAALTTSFRGTINNGLCTTVLTGLTGLFL